MWRGIGSTIACDGAMSRVLITVDARMGRASGIGTYIEQLVPRIVHHWADADFTILGDRDVLARTLASVHRVRFIPLDAPIYTLQEQWALMRAIPPTTSLYWAPHYNIPLLYRGRVAVTVHDVFHLADSSVSGMKRAYARLLFGSVVKRARAVLCDSSFTAAELRRLVGEPRSLHVIHLGVDDDWRAATPLEPPPVARPYWLAVGNVKPHKNLKRLVDAFARIAATVPHRLVIVGRREGLLTLDTDVERLARALGDRVVFTGQVTREDLEQYVASCDALLQPSLYEGFGFPPLEAMACGRAVAVSTAASLPEVCGPEADYFDPLDVSSIASAMQRLARRPADSATVIERRKAWVKRYDWDRCASETVQVLQGAVSA